MNNNSEFDTLPPKPDPTTGEPFPPHGRAWRAHDRKPEDNPYRETRLTYKPSPPTGKGAVLAWHKENRRGKLALFLGSAVVLVLGLILIRAISGADNPFAWLGLWQPWIVVVLGAVLMARPVTYANVSAGSDWFQLQLVRFGIITRRNHINLYNLQSIKVTTGTARFFLELTDENDSIEMATVYWQSDRRIWDLVYNGMLHSIAAGAEVDRNARGFLELNNFPELQVPEGERQIDVTRLSDYHVRELMEDPVVRTMCDGIQIQGDTAEFRQLFPEFDEGMLANPANPEWFATETDKDTNTPDTPRD